jgi:indolepyruvate decarboxylase
MHTLVTDRFFVGSFMLKNTLTVGEFLLEKLKRLHISRVYGIPGDFVIKFFKLLEDDADLELCTFSHEQAVGFAAVADARASRKPAAAVVTYGPGILNTFNAVACAYAERTPLITVVGGPPIKDRANDFFLHHTVKSCNSMLNAVSEVTVRAVLLDNPQTASDKIDEALTACQEYLLPVYIELPSDIVNQKTLAEYKQIPALPVSQENLAEAAQILTCKILQAKNPVVMMGVESDRLNVASQIIKFAKQLNLPVVSTMLARDHIPSDSPNFFGTYLGSAGNPVAAKLVAESDFVLILGEMLSDVNLGAKLTTTKKDVLVWCFSREINTSEQTFVNVPLKQLVAELLKVTAPKKDAILPDRVPLQVNRACKYTANSLVMTEVIDAVNWLFSVYGEMPLVADTGDCTFATLRIQTSTILAPSFYATMGFAVPAAIGYALSTKKRPIVLLGDGGFQMTGQEISHCPKYKINPIFIVINNRRWGMEQLFYPSAHFNELVNWPYAQLAELWGGKGYRCDTCESLYRALQDAQEQKCFTLIEVVTEKDELSDELMAWIVEQRRE